MVNSTITQQTLPETCSVAFKEWAGVCAALVSGRQSLILRKGGIEEGPDGFVPEYPLFWLYPTFVHEAEQGLITPDTPARPSDPGEVSINSLVVVESVIRVDAWDRLLKLDGLHVWTLNTIRKRFDYRTPGLWILGVRVYQRPVPHKVEVTTIQLGCKSWVPLDPALATAGLVSVRSDTQATEDRDRLAERLRDERQGL